MGGAVGWAVGVQDRMSKCPGVRGGWQVGAATKLGCWGWKGVVFCYTGMTLSPYTYPTAFASSSAFQGLRASFAPGNKGSTGRRDLEKKTELKFEKQGGQLQRLSFLISPSTC